MRMSEVSTFLSLSAADCEDVGISSQRFTAARFSDSSKRDDVLPLCRRQMWRGAQTTRIGHGSERVFRADDE